MGSASGGGYFASPNSGEKLKANIGRLAKRYPLPAGGRFGRKGKIVGVRGAKPDAIAAASKPGRVSFNNQGADIRRVVVVRKS